MTQREKILGVAVGGLLLLLVTVWLYTKVDNAMQLRRMKALGLQSQYDDQNLEIEAGLRASDRQRQYESRSLPPDPQIARSLYRAWLQDLVEKQLALESPIVTPGSITAKDDVYHRLSFNVNGRGTLQQLTQLLYRFYSIDYLHQIRSLRVNPVPETRLLDFAITVEALSLSGGTDVEKLSLPKSADLAAEGIEPYLAPILERNLFGPANRSPRLSNVSRQKVELGKNLSLELKADDPDPLDQLTFVLDAKAPTTAKLTPGGKLSFRSEEIGTYEFTVKVVDDGLPPKTDESNVLISVIQRPPPPVRIADNTPKVEPPRFEDGKFAFVTAITEVDGRRQLWLNLRDKDKMLRLFEGDDFQIARLDASVSAINEKEIEVTAGEVTRRYRLGDNLAEGESIAGD